MSEKRIFEKDLIDFCIKSLKKYGVSDKHAEMTAKVLALADTFGIHSHGTKNLRIYIEKFQLGSLDPKAQPEVVKEGLSFAIIDAKDSLGTVASCIGMQKAIDIAEKCGTGFVTVRNSCHFGAAGYYASMAAEQGMIGMAMSNTDPNMVVPGGKGMIIGNNPFAYAIPSERNNIISLDIALSTTAALKINQAKIEKRPIPDTWLVDDEGNPTTNPWYYQNGGALQPMGSHKGYGLSLFIDIITGILSGGSIVRDIPSWCFRVSEKNRASHSFCAINISAMMPPDEFKKRVDEDIDYIKNSPKAKGKDKIYIPGEIEMERRKKALKSGVVMPDDAVESLEELARNTGLKINWIN